MYSPLTYEHYLLIDFYASSILPITTMDTYFNVVFNSSPAGHSQGTTIHSVFINYYGIVGMQFPVLGLMKQTYAPIYGLWDLLTQ